MFSAATQYKDLYTSSTVSQNEVYLANSNKIGDAVYETSTSSNSPYKNSWYGDNSNMPFSNYPFFTRGGYHASNTTAGLFSFQQYDGSAAPSIGFRPVVMVDPSL